MSWPGLGTSASLDTIQSYCGGCQLFMLAADTDTDVSNDACAGRECGTRVRSKSTGSELQHTQHQLRTSYDRAPSVQKLSCCSIILRISNVLYVFISFRFEFHVVLECLTMPRRRVIAECCVVLQRMILQPRLFFTESSLPNVSKHRDCYWHVGRKQSGMLHFHVWLTARSIMCGMYFRMTCQSQKPSCRKSQQESHTCCIHDAGYSTLAASFYKILLYCLVCCFNVELTHRLNQ